MQFYLLFYIYVYKENMVFDALLFESGLLSLCENAYYVGFSF